MVIARQVDALPGSSSSERGVLRWWDGEAWTPRVRTEHPVPAVLRDERLHAQIGSFERAGYRLESIAGPQAVVSRVRRVDVRRNVPAVILTAGLWLIPLTYRLRHRSWHRVVITVDEAGSVRYA
ncbi:DUF2510 domain-containing protein [uncultured Amnibacterium sp.]|uniref:DUF2510 domain-containing protein n=1 Tax=uncultured Amnibacterium sp. TaxID=1631851 RepID=UPI0035CC32C4